MTNPENDTDALDMEHARTTWADQRPHSRYGVMATTGFRAGWNAAKHDTKEKKQ